MSRNDINLGDIFNPDDYDTIIDVDISSAGATGLQQVSHDETLIGDGTAANPLGVDTTKFITQAELDTEIQDRTDADNVLLDQINANTAMIIDKQDKISDLASIRSGANKGATAVQPGELATVARTGSYADLINKPVIPTVNDSTITIKQGGNVKGTFTLNQATGKTIELDAGGGPGEMPKPTRDYSMGSASGNWVEMTTAQKNALNSGATAEKINEIDTNKTTMDNHIADKSNPHDVTKAQVGLGNVDNTSDLNKPISTATQTALDGKQPKSTAAFNVGNATGGWTALTTAQQNALNSGATTTNIAQIATNTTAIATNTANIATNTANIATNTSKITANETAIKTEKTAREDADTALQDQIDALTSKSDVVDVVGTYSDLESYATSTLHNNDVVKVLEDSTHNDSPSYYRWIKPGAAAGMWSYIGSIAGSYTKAETDALLNAKQNTLTTAQLSAVNSGVTSATVAQVATNRTNIATNTANINANQTAIAAETTARENADDALQDQIDTLSTDKQDNLTTAQLAAVNSGVTATTVAQVATNTTDIAGKQDTLTTAQLNAVNSGVTTATVTQVATNTTAIAGKQDTLTTAQLAAVNSGVTASTVSQVATNTTAIAGKQDTITDLATIRSGAALGATAVQPSGVSNATITIKQGTATKGTFTLNQSADATITLDAGGGGDVALNDLTDVTITSASNNQVLTYDTTSSKWVNKTQYAMQIIDHTA